MKKVKVSFDTWIQLLGMLGVLGGLNFVGLELPAYIKQKFSMKYSSREDFLDLEKWHNFELEFPETFISMYRLWCHKK